MNKCILLINNAVIKCKITSKKLSNDLFRTKKGFGMNELLGIAAAIVIAAFIVIPGLKSFTSSIMDKLVDWWGNIENVFFPK